MFYYIFACDSKEIINPKSIERRYKPSLCKHVKKGENGFIIFDYGYKLIKSKEKLNKNAQNALCKIAECKDESEVKSMQEFVRGAKTFIENENNTYKSASCHIYFDGLKGFSALSKANYYAIENIILDYTLMQAYMQKIQDFQDQATQSINKNEHEILKQIYLFDLQMYFSAPIGMDAYQGYEIWQKLAKITGLSAKHDEMLTQVSNLAKLVNEKRQNTIKLFLTIISICLATISAFSVLSPIIKKFF